ncbi:hypothetical protein L6272_03840 [Microgenomates group bacterium]|nr:hypothetical protein [Microgenomates group bacterium]
MAKSAQRLEARKLREQALSINEIANKLNISKRTISRWCNDILLDSKQKQILWSRARTKYNKNFRKYCETKHEKTLAKIDRLKLEGIDKVSKLNKRELFIAGAALYWAEGFKKDMRFGFANSDPKMNKFCLKWLKDCLGIKNQEISMSVTVNISHQKRIQEIEKYWQKETGISKSQFTKPFYQRTKWAKKFEENNKYFGVLRIRVVRSTDLLRKIKGHIEGLKQNVG